MDEARIEEMISTALKAAKKDGVAEGVIWSGITSIGFLVLGFVLAAFVLGG